MKQFDSSATPCVWLLANRVACILWWIRFVEWNRSIRFHVCATKRYERDVSRVFEWWIRFVLTQQFDSFPKHYDALWTRQVAISSLSLSQVPAKTAPGLRHWCLERCNVAHVMPLQRGPRMQVWAFPQISINFSFDVGRVIRRFWERSVWELWWQAL